MANQPLDQAQLAQIVGAVIQALKVQSTSAAPKAAQPTIAKGQFDFAARDRHLLNTFSRRGFKVALMDRNDPTKPYDVRPYKGWLAMGRIVRRGERGVRGLFHVDQTDVIPAKPEPKKGKLFGKAKPHVVA